ncbi:MAG TPA: sulfotransferase [Micromonosporaceae bacterium]|nr:sulfotransferase [Micromonosporaceae bacterium]
MVRVLFLGGMGRSGTTLLERLLGELPGACPLGEVVHLWDRDVRGNDRCACGERFSGCAFWQRVGARAFGGWHRVDLADIAGLRSTVERTRHIPGLAGRRSAPRAALVRRYADYYARLYRAAAEISGASVVIDSSKHPALAFCLRSADIDLRVAHVIRDSRGVAYSWTKRTARPETDGQREMTRYRPGRCAMLWNTNNVALGLLARSGVAVRRVRYEDLLADPATTLAALADFAGLAGADLSFLSTGIDGTPVADLARCHSAAGNPMRFAVGTVALRVDDAWRTALPPAQRRLVGALTMPLLGAYGYRLGREIS